VHSGGTEVVEAMCENTFPRKRSEGADPRETVPAGQRGLPTGTAHHSGSLT
jgi:hypothetical protein